MRLNPAPPWEISAFIGRDGLLAELRGWLDDDTRRLCQISGPPGSGKTRLAAELIRELGSSSRPGRAIWVGVPPTEGGLHSALFRAFDVIPSREAEVSELLHQAFSQEPTFLVLDGADELPGITPRVMEWLSAAPGLRVLVTQRRRANATGALSLECTPLADEEAARLLADRAGQSNHNHEQLIAISKLLDGLPLAIELAAPLVASLGEEVAREQLENHRELALDLEADGVTTEYTSLRAALESTAATLRDAEQELLPCLAFFEESFDSRDALEISPLDGAKTVKALAGLVQSSLVRKANDSFSMLSSVRTWARNLLDEDAQADARERYDGIIERKASRLLDEFNASDGHDALHRMVALTDDLRAVWSRRALPLRPATGRAIGHVLEVLAVPETRMRHAHEMIERGDRANHEEIVHHGHRFLFRARYSAGERTELGKDIETYLGSVSDNAIELLTRQDVVGAIAMEWVRASAAQSPVEFQKRLEAAIKAHDEGHHDTRLRAAVLVTAGVVTMMTESNIEKARELTERGRRLAAHQGPPSVLAWALQSLAYVNMWASRPLEAWEFSQKALAAMRKLGPRETRLANALHATGWAGLDLGYHQEAREMATEAKALQHLLGDIALERRADLLVAAVEHDDGNLGLADDIFGKTLEAARKSEDVELEAMVQVERGDLLRLKGDLPSALEAFRWLDDLEHEGLHRFSIAGTAALASTLAEAGDRDAALAAIGRAKTRLTEHFIPTLDEYVRLHEQVLQAWLSDEPEAIFQNAMATLLSSRDDSSRDDSSRPDSSRHDQASSRWLVSAPVRQVMRHLFRCIDDDRLTEVQAAALDPSGQAFLVDSDAERFRLPGEDWFSFGRKALQKRLFDCLVTARHARPGDTVTAEELIDAGWPGENIMPDAANNRLYKALSQLRGQPGVREHLETMDDGWRFDPAIPMYFLPLS